jgi:uncharacterized protein YndB with AHSA1/START domain
MEASTVTAIEVDQFLRQPPERVWRAITDPDLLSRWLMPNDFKPVVGHQFTFWTDPVPQRGFDGVISCQLLDLEPPRLIRFSWRSRPLDTTVTFRLAAEGAGTRLFIRHDGFAADDPEQQSVMRILGGGWKGHIVGQLDALLAAG